jgi:hypothetical protein
MGLKFLRLAYVVQELEVVECLLKTNVIHVSWFTKKSGNHLFNNWKVFKELPPTSTWTLCISFGSFLGPDQENYPARQRGWSSSCSRSSRHVQSPGIFHWSPIEKYRPAGHRMWIEIANVWPCVIIFHLFNLNCPFNLNDIQKNSNFSILSAIKTIWNFLLDIWHLQEEKEQLL